MKEKLTPDNNLSYPIIESMDEENKKDHIASEAKVNDVGEAQSISQKKNEENYTQTSFLASEETQRKQDEVEVNAVKRELGEVAGQTDIREKDSPQTQNSEEETRKRIREKTKKGSRVAGGSGTDRGREGDDEGVEDNKERGDDDTTFDDELRRAGIDPTGMSIEEKRAAWEQYWKREVDAPETPEEDMERARTEEDTSARAEFLENVKNGDVGDSDRQARVVAERLKVHARMAFRQGRIDKNERDRLNNVIERISGQTDSEALQQVAHDLEEIYETPPRDITHHDALSDVTEGWESDELQEQDLESIKGAVKFLHKSELISRNRYDEYLEEINKLKKGGVVERGSKDNRFAIGRRELAEEIKAQFRGVEFEQLEDRNIQSLDDLARLIMAQETEEWQTGGDSELLDQNEELKLNNFYKYLKGRLLYFDDLNSDDPVQFFSDVSLSTSYRNITLNEILNNPKYARKKVIEKRPKLRWEKEIEKRNVNIDDIDWEDSTMYETYYNARSQIEEIVDEKYVRDQAYDNLLDGLKLEVFLYNSVHNFDANYRKVMGIRKELAGELNKSLYPNVFTKSRDRLLRYLRLPASTEDEMETEINERGEEVAVGAMSDILKNSIFEQNVQGRVGKVIRRSLLAYYHIADEEMVNKVLEEEGMHAFYESVIKNSVEGVLARYMYTNTSPEKYLERLKTIIPYIKDEEFKKKIIEDAGLNEDDVGTQLEGDDVKVKKEFAIRSAKFIYKSKGELDWDEITIEEGKKVEVFSDADAGNGDYNFIEDASGNYFKNGKRGEYVQVENGVGKFKKITGRAPGDFQDLFNPYNDPKKETGLVDITRNAIRAGTKAAEDKNFFDIYFQKNNITDEKDQEKKREKLSLKDKEDVEYGENFAFRMTYFTGISAKNDLGGIGFDKLSNLVNYRTYLERQIKGRGEFGIEDIIPGIHRLSNTLWDAVNVRIEGEEDYNTPLIHAIQGGEGEDIDLKDEKTKGNIKNFDFQGNAERQYLIEVINEAFSAFEILRSGKGLNIKSFASWEINPATGHKELRINYQDGEKAFFDLWHNLRYAYDSPGYLYNKEYRGYHTYEAENKENEIEPIRIFSDEKLVNAMFNEELRNMKMYEREEFQKDKINPHDENNQGKMARNALAYMIAKELLWHRKEGGPEKWEYGDYQLVKKFLLHFPYDTEEVINPDGTRSVKYKSHFFSEDEYENSIAERAGVESGKLFWKRLSFDALKAAVEGGYASLKQYLKLVFSE